MLYGNNSAPDSGFRPAKKKMASIISFLRKIVGSVEYAECGVRSAECGVRSVENAECGKCGV